MHELSVAQNILEIVRQSVPREELADVRVVRLKLGTFAGVVADSLDFCFSAITAGSELSNARLSFEHVPFVVHCRECQKTFDNDIGFVVCPHCESVNTVILSGRELQVTEIELTTEQEKSP